MKDSRALELQAEGHIMSLLLRHDFKLSKPSFDENGADLLILDDIQGRNAKFVKIQSKLRTIGPEKPSNVEIPEAYVTDNFVLILYVNQNDTEPLLLAFFKDDFQSWGLRKEKFVLQLSQLKLSEIESLSFNERAAKKIRSILMAQEETKYTSIIIDGIFLERAVHNTRQIYSKIWPNKKFKKPTLAAIATELVLYSQFDHKSADVSCIIFLSEDHSLENIIDLPSPLNLQTRGLYFTIRKTGHMVVFEVLSHLNRLMNAENVILVADDAAYESSLNEISESGIDLVLFKEKSDQGSRMFTSMRWGDIAYPIGKALGLKSYEL